MVKYVLFFKQEAHFLDLGWECYLADVLECFPWADVNVAQTSKFAVRSDLIWGTVLNAQGANRFSRAIDRYICSF